MDWGHLPRLMYLVHGYAPLGIHEYSVETISALWVYMGFISILDFFFTDRQEEVGYMMCKF